MDKGIGRSIDNNITHNTTTQSRQKGSNQDTQQIKPVTCSDKKATHSKGYNANILGYLKQGA